MQGCPQTSIEVLTASSDIMRPKRYERLRCSLFFQMHDKTFCSSPHTFLLLATKTWKRVVQAWPCEPEPQTNWEPDDAVNCECVKVVEDFSRHVKSEVAVLDLTWRWDGCDSFTSMNVEVCCWVLLWSYLHLGRDHLPDTSLVFSVTSPSVISTMSVVSSAIMGSVVWEITQSYVKRAYSIGLSTCAWGNPHAHSCSLMLNWFQTLIWVYVMDPLIHSRVVWGWVRPGQSVTELTKRPIHSCSQWSTHGKI